MLRRSIAVLSAALLLCLASVRAEAQDSPIELSFNTWVVNELHPLYTTILKPWADEVERRSDGQIKVTFYLANSLASNDVAWEAVRDGITDIMTVNVGRWPKRFPLNRLRELPLIYSSAEVATKAAMDLEQKYPQFKSQYDGWKVLWASNNDVGHAMMVKGKPVKTVQDVRGKVIANFGAISSVVELLGGSPALTNTNDLYSGLEKKVFDGVWGNIAWFKSLHMEEVIGHFTVAGFGSNTIAVIMNEEKYEGLDPDLKAVVDEVSAEMVLKQAHMFDDFAEEEVIGWLRTEHPGVEVYVLPDEERKRWVERVRPLWDAWVEDVEALGFPGEDMLKDFVAFAAAHE